MTFSETKPLPWMVFIWPLRKPAGEMLPDSLQECLEPTCCNPDILIVQGLVVPGTGGRPGHPASLATSDTERWLFVKCLLWSGLLCYVCSMHFLTLTTTLGVRNCFLHYMGGEAKALRS